MIVVGLASAALAGQVSYEHVELDALIERSPVIVVATINDPPTSAGARLTAEGCEPVGAEQYHVTVTRVLKTTPDGPAADDRLTAWAGNTAQRVELAVAACKDGTSKSPIFPSYGGKMDWVAGDSVVLFLQWDDKGGWELVAEDAFEPGKKLKKVEKILFPPAS